jgi:hypothetical protein
LYPAATDFRPLFCCSIKGILLSIVFVLGIEMKNLNKNKKKKKNNTIVSTAMLLSLATIIVVAIGVTTTPLTAFNSTRL